jgi:hypothetical protein
VWVAIIVEYNMTEEREEKEDSGSVKSCLYVGGAGPQRARCTFKDVNTGITMRVHEEA